MKPKHLLLTEPELVELQQNIRFALQDAIHNTAELTEYAFKAGQHDLLGIARQHFRVYECLKKLQKYFEQLGVKTDPDYSNYQPEEIILLLSNEAIGQWYRERYERLLKETTL